jgi:hypothetical protein
MPGDVNQSAEVEPTDYNFTNDRIGQSTTTTAYSKFADVDGSGVIETEDADDIWSKMWSTYPSQAPIGAGNDAPSAVSTRSLDVDDAMGDVAVSLYGDFQDGETADQQLTYQIIGNTNPSLFQTASINSSSGLLTLNAAANQSGRSTITVKATDTAGIWTTASYVVDVNYANQLPTLSFVVLLVEGITFRVIGSVGDDDANLEGLYVVFSGAFEARASVREDGSFEFCVIVPETDWGTVYGEVTDLQSDTPGTDEDTVGVT